MVSTVVKFNVLVSRGATKPESLPLSLKWCFQGMCFSLWPPDAHNGRYPGLPEPRVWEQGWGCAPWVGGSSVLHADGLGFRSQRWKTPADGFQLKPPCG